MTSISLIIPAFNNKADLLVTIGSLSRIELQEQTEIIIADGSSKPISDTLEISKLVGIKEESVNYLNGPDRGVYDAMNKGILIGKNKWMWFLNSGDEAIKLPTQATMKTSKGIIIGRWMTTCGDIMTPSKESGLTSGSRSEIGCGLCHQAMLFNRNRFDKKLYDYRKYSLAAELNYFYSAIAAEDYCLDRLFMVKYDNKRGMSKEKAVEHLRQSMTIYRENNFKMNQRRLLHRYLSAQWNQWQAGIRQ